MSRSGGEVANAAVCLAARDLAQPDKTKMYYTYVLISRKNNDFYIGSTENLEERISLHNMGKVKSTRPYRPWELLEYETFDSRSEAVRRERFLKNHQQKEILRRKYGAVAKR